MRKSGRILLDKEHPHRNGEGLLVINRSLQGDYRASGFPIGVLAWASERIDEQDLSRLRRASLSNAMRLTR